MEANSCDVNRLDSDVLLPPRKRLLACMKKQNGDVNGNSYSPSTSSSMNDLDIRLNNLLSAHLNTDNPSQEEIVEASRSAAEVAVKIAMAARAAAEEKAVIAAMAMAAAKKALELVATVDEQETSSSTGQQSKKHVQVQMLYDNKNPGVVNGKMSDEELARQLHHAMNSSPRISKYGSPPDLKSHRHKRLKIPILSENGRISNGSVVVEGNSPSASNINKIICDRVACAGNVDENATKIDKVDTSRMENADEGRIRSKIQFGEEDMSNLGRKRGRMKQKKLPLSICHDRDQSNPKEDRRWRSSELVEENVGKVTAAKDKTLLSVGSSANSVVPIERNSLWKCQAFKAANGLKQNKAMQS